MEKELALDPETIRVRGVIAHNLKMAIDVLKLNSMELSRRTGHQVTHQYIRKILKEQTSPSVRVLSILARALNIQMEYLLTEKTEIRPVPLAFFDTLPPEVQDFYQRSDSRPYMIVAKELADQDITPEKFDAIKDLLSSIVKALNK